jgi:hypothetical protein
MRRTASCSAAARPELFVCKTIQGASNFVRAIRLRSALSASKRSAFASQSCLRNLSSGSKSIETPPANVCAGECLRRRLREHRVAEAGAHSLTDEHRRRVAWQADVRLHEVAEIIQIAVGKDALGVVALQLGEQRTRIDPGDERALRSQRLSTAQSCSVQPCSPLRNNTTRCTSPAGR